MVGMICAICFALAGLCKSIKDKLDFHYHGSVFKKLNPNFWNPDASWKNKYKEDLKTPKFFGSTTFLVWATDAWHLFETLHLTFMQLPFAIVCGVLFGSVWVAIGVFLAVKLLCGIIFEMFWRLWS